MFWENSRMNCLQFMSSLKWGFCYFLISIAYYFYIIYWHSQPSPFQVIIVPSHHPLSPSPCLDAWEGFPEWSEEMLLTSPKTDSTFKSGFNQINNFHPEFWVTYLSIIVLVNSLDHFFNFSWLDLAREMLEDKPANKVAKTEFLLA